MVVRYTRHPSNMWSIAIFLLSCLSQAHTLGGPTAEWTSDCGVSQFEDAGVPPLGAQVLVGWEPRFNELPYQVLLNNRTGALTEEPLCGGALINNRWVLTSAGCLEGIDNSTLEVVLGEHRREQSNPFRMKYTAVGIHIHPGYVRAPQLGVMENDDVALIRLDRLAPTTIASYPVCRPPTTYNHTEGLVCGWGANDDVTGPPTNELRCTYLEFITDAACQAAYSDYSLDPASHVCVFTPGRDVCTVDRGSPIVVKMDGLFYIVGISSWSVGCATGPPSVFMDIGHYEDWITQTILDNNE